jgi:hypothetical protein
METQSPVIARSGAPWQSKTNNKKVKRFPRVLTNSRNDRVNLFEECEAQLRQGSALLGMTGVWGDGAKAQPWPRQSVTGN